MESPSMPPSSPSCATPLYPVSPERINRRAAPQTPSCLSPRLKGDPFFSSSHRNSDVQGKVLQFNQLTESLSPKRRDNDAALRRAMLGREEAETKMRSLDEENALLRAQVEEGRARERKVAQRVEEMMEDVQHHKESGTRTQAVYEKEIRRARKEAFKSSSALVKLQEELKTARNRYTLMREEAEEHKRRLESKEQETFAAQLKLVSMEGELEKVRQLLMTVEQERDALRTSLKEEEVARIAAEGRIPLPPSADDDEFSSPRKFQHQPPVDLRSESNETAATTRSEEQDSQVKCLKLELGLERRLRREAQEIVTFMKLECQLQACSCRRAEQDGGRYIHDQHFRTAWSARPEDQCGPSVDISMQEQDMPPEESVIIRPASKAENPIPFSPMSEDGHKPPSPRKAVPPPPAVEEKGVTAATVNVSILSPPTTAPSLAPPLAPTALSESPSLLSLPGRSSDECHVIPSLSTPTTPHQQQTETFPNSRSAPCTVPAGSEHEERVAARTAPASAPSQASGNTPGLRLVTNTTTTKVPLADPDAESDRKIPTAGAKFPFSPGATKTREEALQSIQRWRQGRARARSVTTGSTSTKRSGTGNGSPVRRDISAPERRGI